MFFFFSSLTLSMFFLKMFVVCIICTRGYLQNDVTGVMSSIQRCHKYFQFPLAIIVFNRILLYVDDPETMESILTAPECLNKTFLQNGFYANKGLLHAKGKYVCNGISLFVYLEYM